MTQKLSKNHLLVIIGVIVIVALGVTFSSQLLYSGSNVVGTTNLNAHMTLNKERFSRGDTMVLTIKNAGTTDIGIGNKYETEYLKDGKWVIANWPLEGIVKVPREITAEGHVLMPGDLWSQSIALGDIPAGTYRISKEVWAARIDEIRTTLYATFQVVEAATSNSTKIVNATLTLYLAKSSYRLGENVTFNWVIKNTNSFASTLPGHPKIDLDVLNSTKLVWSTNWAKILIRDGQGKSTEPQLVPAPMVLAPSETLSDKVVWNMTQRGSICDRGENFVHCRFVDDVSVPSGQYRLIMHLTMAQRVDSPGQNVGYLRYSLEVKFTILPP